MQDLQAFMQRVNLKMVNQYPGGIPSHLAPHIMAMSPADRLTFLEGHMKSGCVHLVIDVMSNTVSSQWDVAAAVHRLVAFDPFWRLGTFLLQLPSGAAQWHNGHIVKLWSHTELHSATPQLLTGTPEAPMLPCIVSGQPAKLKVQGSKPQTAEQGTSGKELPPVKVFGRYMGKFVVNPDLLSCPDCQQNSEYGAYPAAAMPGEVVVPGLAGVGLLTLEAEHSSLLSAAQPVVVAPDAATQQDVCKLVQHLQLAG